MSTILVTGAAGFIGFHLSRRLLERGDHVVGYDNLNDYYDVDLKQARLSLLTGSPNFTFVQAHLEDGDCLKKIFHQMKPSKVVNLAAQAGVRFSITNPHCFIQSNLLGFLNVLEACRERPVEHLVFASSSSVYGTNTRMPFSPHDPVNHPISLYAASKRANELMAHAYSHGFGIPSTGVRFFTVYGPYGRPDMALYKFTKNIFENKPIEVYNDGKMLRNFTYIDDAIAGLTGVLDHPPQQDPNWEAGDSPDPATSNAPFRLYNVGSNEPTPLMEFIQHIEKAVGREAEKRYLPLQAGDVLATFADIEDLVRDTGYTPTTSIADGIAQFVAWYRDYYKVTTPDR